MKQKRRTLLIFVCLLVGAALIKSLLIDRGSGKIPTGEIYKINRDWEEVVDEENYHEFLYRIPEKMQGERIICMENAWVAVRLLLDGKEIYSYKDEYNEFGEQRAWVEIPAGSGGKELIFRITGPHGLAERAMSNAMYIGEKNAVFMQSLTDSLYALIFFLCMLIIFCILVSTRIKIRRRLSAKHNRQMVFMGAFILSMALWILTDSKILQIFMRRTAVVNLLSFVCFCMTSGFLALFFKESLASPGKRFDIIFDISAINTSLVAAAYLFRFIPVYKVLVLHHLFLIITIPIILKKGFQEVKHYQNKGVERIMKGFSVLCVCMMVSAVLFYTGFGAHYSYFYITGFSVFLIYVAIAVYEEIYFYLEQNTETAFYRKMAVVDSMTGMGNRSAFEMFMENAVSSEGTAVIMIDNNNLKTVNDRYGHQEGDELLKETARCITETLGRLGQCFRIGGDEFLVVMDNVTEQEVRNSLDFMMAAIGESNSRRHIQVEVAYGYYISPDSGVNMRELFKNADEYMYRNKKRMKAVSE